MEVTGVVVDEAAAGDAGAEVTEDAADEGRRFSTSFRSNFRLRSRLKQKIIAKHISQFA